MKTTLLLISAFLISAVCIAQNGINYKAIIKDANDIIIANQNVDIKFAILENGTTNVYEETYEPATTDANGLVSVFIGEGDINFGDFTTIDWGSADYFINVKIDIGDGYVDMGTTQFKSVPYAQVAETVKNSPVSNFALAKATTNFASLGGNFTKITFTTEAFDLNNNFEPDPNFTQDPSLSRFTVTQAGHYKIKADLAGSFPRNDEFFNLDLAIYKNGIRTKAQFFVTRTAMTGGQNRDVKTISSIEYMVPGDYIEIYGAKSSSVQILNVTVEIERIR